MAGIEANFESIRKKGLNLTKEDILLDFFRYLYSIVIKKCGNQSFQAVFSIPVWFGSDQISSISKAAEMAGFSRKIFIKNPLAAFFGDIFPDQAKKITKMFVYDFGRSSFDVSLLGVEDENVVIVTSQTDKNLGGLQIEKDIVETIFLPKLKKSYPYLNFYNFESDPIYYKLLFTAEKAKIELSSKEESKIHEFFILDENGEYVELSHTFKQNELHQIMDPYITQSINICKKILIENEITSNDLDYILMVGGQTSNPYLQDEVHKMIQIPLLKAQNPLTVMSYGALIYGNSLSSHLDETSNSLVITEPNEREGQAYVFEKVDESDMGKLKTHDLDEDVQFTVLRPKKIQPDTWYDLLAFAHLSEKRQDAPKDEPDPIEEVKRQVKQILQEKIDDYGEIVQDSSQAVPREGKITFIPQVEGITFNPPEKTFYWYESVHREDFRLKTSSKYDKITLRGNFTVFLGNIILCYINLAIKVDSEISKKETSLESVTAAAYRKIFASYSHDDISIVNEFENYGSSVGDQYLIDQNHLRTGEIWNDRLMQMIKEADIFQLFWSWNSIQSKFVQKEYEYALSLNRNNFIRPVYWEKPFPQIPERNLPPEELCQIQFGKIRPKINSLTENSIQKGVIKQKQKNNNTKADYKQKNLDEGGKSQRSILESYEYKLDGGRSQPNLDNYSLRDGGMNPSASKSSGMCCMGILIFIIILIIIIWFIF